VENCSAAKLIKMRYSFVNWGCPVLWTEEEKDHPACHQFKSLHGLEMH